MRKAVRVRAERKACGAPEGESRVRVPVGRVLGFSEAEVEEGEREVLVLVLVLVLVGVWVRLEEAEDFTDAEEEDEGEEAEGVPTVTTFIPVKDSVRAGMNSVVASLVAIEVRSGWFWLQPQLSSCVPVE